MAQSELSAAKNMNASRAGSRLALLGLAVVLLGGLVLRLIYLLGASPFVDEYSTLMAVRGILARGVPFLPTGFFYGHDPLYSYAATTAALFLPDDLLAVRLLSLLASLIAIALAFALGRRLFSTRAGLLAAALLALLPESVLWGARARAYALELTLALVAFWLFYRGVTDERPAWRRLGLLALVAAVFTHPESALLLPGLALAVLVLHGLRWWLHLDRLLEFALAGAGVIGRYLLQKVVAGGDVGGFDAIADARPTFGFLANWQGGLETLGEFLFSGPVIVAAALAFVAVVALALRRRPPSAVATPTYATRFLALTLAAILLQMALVIGGTWQSVRYLMFAYPLLFLLVGAGFEVVAGWLAPRLPRPAVSITLAALAALALLPALAPAVRAANTAEIAYDRAFDHVAAHWQPGDRLATLAPAAAWLSLGQVDYFALGQTYEEFVWQREGRWYDKWVGAELVHTAAEMTAALDQAEAAEATLWLVTDEDRLLRRYDTEFVQTIWNRMNPVFSQGQAQVFRAQPAQEYAVAIDTPRRETFAGRIALAGYALGAPDQSGAPPAGALLAQPGASLPVQLTWQAITPLTDTYTLFLHLNGPDGTTYARADGLPLGGLYPMHLWQPGIRYPDRWTLDLPPDLAPGRYRLEMGLYALDTGDRLPVTAGPGRLPGEALILDYLTVPGAPPPPPPDQALDADLGGAARLLGLSPALGDGVARPGDTLALTLHWLALAPTAENYTLFVHVVGPDGAALTQFDGQPQGGFYPTAFWDPGERLADPVTLSLPADLVPGEYPLVAGLYLLVSGERLPVTGADAGPAGTVRLGTLVVEP